jgi:hypothetical protein
MAKLGELMGWQTPATVCAAEGYRSSYQRRFTVGEVEKLAAIFAVTPEQLNTRCVNCGGHPEAGFACLRCGAATPLSRGARGRCPGAAGTACASNLPGLIPPLARSRCVIPRAFRNLSINGMERDMIKELTAAEDRFPLCLNDIDGFESLIARMPTPEECRDNGLPADAPVLVMRRGGGEQVYPADMVRLTSPAPSAARDAACYVAGQIIEDLDNVRAKIAVLCHAVESPSNEIIRLADEYRQQRAAQI